MEKYPNEFDHTYLGDGVYASHDGYQVWLRTEVDTDRVYAIALDPSVMSALQSYWKRITIRTTAEIEEK